MKISKVNKSAQKIQDEIFIKMSAKEKIGMVSRFYKTAQILKKAGQIARRTNPGK